MSHVTCSTKSLQGSHGGAQAKAILEYEPVEFVLLPPSGPLAPQIDHRVVFSISVGVLQK